MMFSRHRLTMPKQTHTRLLVDNIEEIAPLIYTPTVGHVCQHFGEQVCRNIDLDPVIDPDPSLVWQYRRARGMFFSREDRGHFASMVYMKQYISHMHPYLHTLDHILPRIFDAM